MKRLSAYLTGLLVALCGATVGAEAAAQAGGAATGERVAPEPAAAPAQALAVHAYTLTHQPVVEAVELIRPLLSPRGTVEIQPGGNTLVVRDSLAALARIAPVLSAFDHPARPVRVEILVVRASTSTVSPPLESTAPPQLVDRLRKLLRYDVFELLAQADLTTLEGQKVTYQMGGDFGVSFQLGTLVADRRIKLHGFQIRRRGEIERPLLHTNLNLWLDQTVTLALARSETAGSALMVVVTSRRATAPTPAGRAGGP